MNQTTPKSSGINYAKLRKQKSKESTIPKTLSQNLQFDNQQNNQYGFLKHKSNSQHNIKEDFQSQQKISLFKQYFNQSKHLLPFIEFVTKQIQYHSKPIQINTNIFKNCQRRWEEDRQIILNELNQSQEDNCIIKTEIQELKRENNTLNKQCENLQLIIVHERLGKQQKLHHIYKFQELTNNIHVPTHETISSLTDERFESNETSLDSSLSNDDNNHNQLFELLKTTKHRYQFSKKLY